MALSKTWTLVDLIADIKALISSDFPNEKILDLEFREFLNIALLQVAKELNAVCAPDYGEIKTFTSTDIVDNIIDIASLNFDSIVKLTNSLYGLVPDRSIEEMDNYKNIQLFKNCRFYARFGEKLILFIGNEITEPGVYALYYYRLPKFLSDDAEYIDIKDQYVPLVMAKTKAMIYEKLHIASPEIPK